MRHDETHTYTAEQEPEETQAAWHEQEEASQQEQQEKEQQATSDEHNQCKARIQQLEDQLAYLSSDFNNYRRNIEKEKTRWQHEARGSVLSDLLTVVDEVDRAVADLESQDLPEEAVKRLEGIKLIHKSLLKLLDTYEVHEITQVTTFDPQWHEAVMRVSETDVSSGDIVSVVQKGYTHKGELLRTAKVTVAE